MPVKSEYINTFLEGHHIILYSKPYLTFLILRTIPRFFSKGDPKIYKLELNLNYVVSENGKKVLEDKILKESTYNNINDKYELSKHEQNVLNNLSLMMSNEILFSIKVLNK